MEKMEKTEIKSWKVLNGNALKIIAMIAMLIDHIGVAILQEGILSQPELSRELWEHYYDIYMIMRMVGRISFPIFCFLLVEGFYHTKNLKSYASRLLLFAVLSEIPFDLAVYGSFMYLGHQNIYFTLFLGLAAMAGVEKYRGDIWKQAVIVVAASGLAMVLKTDYSAFGVCLILLFYVFRDQPTTRTLVGCLYTASSQMLSVVFAFIPIQMYNGTRGKWNWKYVFYAFYPVHLLILWMVRMVIL